MLLVYLPLSMSPIALFIPDTRSIKLNTTPALVGFVSILAFRILSKAHIMSYVASSVSSAVLLGVKYISFPCAVIAIGATPNSSNKDSNKVFMSCPFLLIMLQRYVVLSVPYGEYL